MVARTHGDIVKKNKFDIDIVKSNWNCKPASMNASSTCTTSCYHLEQVVLLHMPLIHLRPLRLRLKILLMLTYSPSCPSRLMLKLLVKNISYVKKCPNYSVPMQTRMGKFSYTCISIMCIMKRAEVSLPTANSPNSHIIAATDGNRWP